MFRLRFGDFFVPKQAQENALHPGNSGGGTGPGGCRRHLCIMRQMTKSTSAMLMCFLLWRA